MTRQPVVYWLVRAACVGGALFALASPAQAMDDATAAQLAALQQQVDTLNQRLSAAQSQQASPILTLQSQIDDLKSDLEKLRGRLDEQAHELSVAEKRQTDLYQDLDSRLRALTQNGTSGTSGASGASSGSGAANSADVAANGASGNDTSGNDTSGNGAADTGNGSQNAMTAPAGGDTVTRDYQLALSQFKQGDYKGAIGSFQKFVKANPHDERASSAQYWIGNAFFSLKNFKSAAAAQQRLMVLYPHSPKVPDAMLNLSSAQVEMGNLDAAQATLKKLVRKFPNTPAAQLGRKRLQLLESN
jgi:tol-pal system protein YbgF